MSAWRRYRIGRFVRTIRALATVDDSPHRFWRLPPHDRSQLQTVYHPVIDQTCQSFHPPISVATHPFLKSIDAWPITAGSTCTSNFTSVAWCSGSVTSEMHGPVYTT